MTRNYYSRKSWVSSVMLLSIAVIGFLVVQAGGESRAALKPTVSSVSKATDNSLFTVEIIKQGDFSVGINTFDLKVNGKNDYALEGAEIRVVPWMAEHIHGVADTPVITEKGKGLYQVENVNLLMKGNWELRLRVIKGPDQDTVVFEVPNVGSDQ